MDGIREDSLASNPTPTDDYKVRGLDANGKSCVIPFSAFNSGAAVPQENDIKDFLEGSTIVKKRYVSGSWVSIGIEWEI